MSDETVTSRARGPRQQDELPVTNLCRLFGSPTARCSSVSFLLAVQNISTLRGIRLLLLLPERSDCRLWLRAEQAVVSSPPQYLRPHPPLTASAERRTAVHPTAEIATTADVALNVYVGPRAVIGERTTVGAGTRIEAGVVIGDNVTIGSDCVLHPNVTLYDDVTLGDRVVLHAGVCIGADGFGYVRDDMGYHKFRRSAPSYRRDVSWGATCVSARRWSPRIGRAQRSTTREVGTP